MFKKVHINIPLLEAINEISKYAKFLKEFCTKKQRDWKPEKVKVSLNVSAVILRNIPPKCKDPSMFSLSCMIENKEIKNNMLDLGDSINVMPFCMYKDL